jgi:hypothetical protein
LNLYQKSHGPKTGSFQDIVKRLKDEKLKMRLDEWIEKRTALLTDLEKLKSKKD